MRWSDIGKLLLVVEAIVEKAHTPSLYGRTEIRPGPGSEVG